MSKKITNITDHIEHDVRFSIKVCPANLRELVKASTCSKIRHSYNTCCVPVIFEINRQLNNLTSN